MNEIKTAFEMNPLFSIGCLLFMIGISVFCFGKKFFLFRLFFGDRSMFSQIFWGLIFSGIGLLLILFFKQF